jgi:hypothetical protein
MRDRGGGGGSGVPKGRCKGLKADAVRLGGGESTAAAMESSPAEAKSRLERRRFRFTVERAEESNMLHP